MGERALADIESAKKGKGLPDEETDSAATDTGTIKNDSSQATLIKELGEKIGSVHQVCGFDTDARDPLQMLSQIEAKLEDVFAMLDYNEDLRPEDAIKSEELVQRLEREKEKERRERVRQERIEFQNSKNEERLKASLLRSQAPVYRRTGKPIMFRSRPKILNRKVEKVDLFEVEADRYWKLFGVYVDKNG